MNKFWKYFGIVVGVLVLIFIIMTVWGYSAPHLRKWVFNMRAEKYNREYYKDIAEREEAIRNDNVGGKTPEETIQMFIDALERKDIEGARGLYRIDDRENIYENNDNAKIIADNVRIIINGGEKDCFINLDKNNSCSWKIFDDKSGLYMIIGVEKNEFTGVWKLIR